jgi:hypothetical protein
LTLLYKSGFLLCGLSSMSATTLIADLLSPFCEAASVSLREPQKTLRKRILVSLSFVDTEQLHRALFKEQHID